ncbi:hypothetical protein [Candidatus Nitrotoga sp. BS]|uniref:hypothetical protein n=1 Tax=Candidatus Nitrotoga sp. BS TaxID=2890408 RepID=UPI00403DA3FA
MPAAAAERFNAIRRGNLKTARAWALKESLRELWCYHSTGWAGQKQTCQRGNGRHPVPV